LKGEKEILKVSKLEAYLKILEAVRYDGNIKTNSRQNQCLEGIALRRALNFLVRQKVITRCSATEKNTYKITERGSSVLRYFAPNQRGPHIEFLIENLEINE
jgi:hypothetical protein